MFHTLKSDNKKFQSFDEAINHINQREYDSTSFAAKDTEIEHDGFIIQGKKFPIYDVFIDSLFGNTKLPRKNESVLPTENVISDLNTLLKKMGDDQFDLKMLNGAAYSMTKFGSKGARSPLTHKQFLDILQTNTDIKDVKSISLTPKFLRVSTYNDQMTQEVLEGDFHHFGIDYSNGEIYRSNILTAGLMLYRISCSNSAVAPFDDKYVRLRPTTNPKELQQHFAEVCTSLNIDYDMIKERIERVAGIKMNASLLKFIAGGLGFAPLEIKEKLFNSYFEQDDEGNVTKSIKPNVLENISIYDVFNDITRAAHHNTGVDETTRYRMETFAGSLLDEKNKKVREILAV